MIKTIGSICSGIEAANVAWQELNYKFLWLSEIAKFQNELLKIKYPNIPNVGDMNDIDLKIKNKEISAPDLICGGTPCQAFSLAGLKNGLNDNRGNLTLKFVDIINENDKIRANNHLPKTIILWENVEGVLKDKTNAFGCLVSSLAGLDDILNVKKWPNAGLLRGPERNVAWRVLDAKYFGLPQQRKRLYLVAGGKDYNPENVLFEEHFHKLSEYPLNNELIFYKNGCKFEIFREYTDCLYSSYGTKWNGNAAAYNGSLYVVQDDKIRRLSPLECERLMGFPDNYTNIPSAKRTNRYQAIGNSWAIPVIKWLGERFDNGYKNGIDLNISEAILGSRLKKFSSESFYLDMGKDIIQYDFNNYLNCTEIPENSNITTMKEIIDDNPPKEIYITPVGCYGIIRRKQERNLKINSRLEEVLLSISSQMTPDEIEKRSRVQKRGRFSE